MEDDEGLDAQDNAQEDRSLMGIRRNRKKVDPSRLHPVMAQGLTQGRHSLQEAKELPDLSDRRDSGDVVRDVLQVEAVGGSRVPLPRFVAEDSLSSVWSLGDDRLQRDSVQHYPPEVVEAIRNGHICLRCMEPQPEAFPDICDLCTYPMKDRQIMDFAMEFEGTTHYGPTRPISEYMLDQELEREKQKFAERQKNGGKKIVMPRGV